MSAVRKVTQIQFESWEPHNIVPEVRRGWPDSILNAAATHVERPPALDGTLTDPLWSKVNYVEPPVPFCHDSPLVSTMVYLAWDNKTLYVGVRALLPSLDGVVGKNGAAEYERRGGEKLSLAIDKRHNHGDMQTVSINARGEVEWYDDVLQMAGFSDEVGFQYYWWTLNEVNPEPAARAAEMGVRGAARVAGTEWTAELAIPLVSLDIETPIPGMTVGIEVIRTATERPIENFDYHFTWMPQYPGTLGSPTKMGILSFGPAPISLEAIDFPNCSWGINHASVRLRNNARRKLNVVMISRGVCGSEPRNTHVNSPVESGPVEISAEESVLTTFEYHMPVRFLPEYVELEVRDHASGDRLMRITFNLGTCAVVYPFGQEKGIAAPALDDPDFIENRHRYIVSRQPLLRRRTTRQGAPSDFYIEAVDGSVAFDLMKDGVLQAIADWLCSLYDNDIDRVIGATFFMAQQAVYVYASRRAQFAGLLDPLSNLRLGGGMCGEFGRSLAGLLSRMTSAITGERFRSRRINVGGHALATVRMFDRWVLLDATTKNVKAFFHRDHKTLASAQDLERDPSLITYNGSTSMVFANPTLLQRTSYGTTWPDGAPAE